MEADLAQTARAYFEMVDEKSAHGTGANRPIDLVHLAKQTFGERDLESELLRLFDRQSAQILAHLAGHDMTAGRVKADIAHTLKGSARAVGAFGVASAAEEYESAAARGEDDKPAFEHLAQAVAAAHGAIAELLAN